jgi:hypothetical protein
LNLVDDEHCSYWIKPPKKFVENDYIELTLKGFAENQVSVMIVKEDSYGNIKYIKNNEIVVNNDRSYSFFLRKMEIKDYDDL